MKPARAFACVVGALLALVAGTSVRADEVADFYKDKTLTMVIGSAPGGGYDTLARAVSNHLPRHIPGNPTIIMKHMPGAGGIQAIKHVYALAPRDGTTLGLMRNMVPIEPLLGTPQADYDATKLNWLGTLAVETGLMIVWHTSPFKSIEDVRQKEFTVAADGGNSQSYFFSRLFNDILGTKIKVVGGYKGQGEAFLAIERGEVDSFGITYWSALTSARRQWLAENKIRVLLQYGPVKVKELGDVPYGPDLVKNEEDRQLFRAAYSPLTLGRPFVLPPDVPPARVAAFRKALMAMIADPVFVADAAKQGLLIDSPMTGEQLQDELKRIYSMPQKVLERLKRLAQER